MPSGEKIGNRLKTLAMVVVFGIFAFYVPLRLAASDRHTMLLMLEPFRFLGPILIVLGVIGYIMSNLEVHCGGSIIANAGRFRQNYHHGDLSLYEKPHLHLRLDGPLWGIPIFYLAGPAVLPDFLDRHFQPVGTFRRGTIHTSPIRGGIRQILPQGTPVVSGTAEAKEKKRLTSIWPRKSRENNTPLESDCCFLYFRS
jgi:hypothetical protein